MVSAIVPTYNEAPTIASFLSQLVQQLENVREPFEIWVVDDDSPDRTADAVSAAFDRDARIRLLRRPAPRSLGAAIRDGIERGSSDKVIVMDSDFNHDPRAVPYLLAYLDDFDLVIGSRFAAGGGMPDQHRHVGSFAINLFLRVLLRTQVQDNLSGFFAIRRDALLRLPFDEIFWGYGDYFFRLVFFGLRAPLRILEVPVVYGPRKGGTSKTSLLKTTCQYLYEIVKFRVRYLRPPMPDVMPQPFYAHGTPVPLEKSAPRRTQSGH